MPHTTAKTLPASLLAGIAVATALVWAPPGAARVTRIVIDTQGPVTGQTPPPAGYEELTGRAFGELDPHDSQNELITDIKRAPRNARGKVEYIASFRIRKPTDMSVASGLMWHDVPNRGGNVDFSSDLIAAGDMQLLSGWQGDNAGATRRARERGLPAALRRRRARRRRSPTTT